MSLLLACTGSSAVVSAEQHRQTLANVNAALKERDERIKALQAERAMIARELDTARRAGKKQTTALRRQVAATQEELVLVPDLAELPKVPPLGDKGS